MRDGLDAQNGSEIFCPRSVALLTVLDENSHRSLSPLWFRGDVRDRARPSDDLAITTPSDFVQNNSMITDWSRAIYSALASTPDHEACDGCAHAVV
ncbi:hypothetical protein BDV93DRAFT_522565 [Ceratobasidium sp. AG-I]|nr:hypothetical protein BDV93DRAFT_522565 [Ceratobasidium sp. AG-I]